MEKAGHKTDWGRLVVALTHEMLTGSQAFIRLDELIVDTPYCTSLSKFVDEEGKAWAM